MGLLIGLFISIGAYAEPLAVYEILFRAPKQAATCGLLRHREKERLKVVRELSHLTRKYKDLEKDAPAPGAYGYWLEKLFMPSEDWAELTTEVALRVYAPKELRKQIAEHGLESVFLITRGPGYVWQSYANQLPPEMSIAVEGEYLRIRYLTFLNAICAPDLPAVSVEWVSL